jgi:N-methylhydantoinase A
MVQAIMAITVNQGIDPTAAAFVAGGGAAGLNCVAIGRRLGCRQVIVPETAAALSAAGALFSDLTAHVQAVFPSHSGRFDTAGVNAVLAGLLDRCRAFAEGPGAGASATLIHWSVEARYPDQAWEIEVPLRQGRFDDESDVRALMEDFHRTHQEVYAVSDPDAPIEAVAWGAEVHCRLGSDEPGRLAEAGPSEALLARAVCFAGVGWLEAPVHRFEALPGGIAIAGPAIVESGFTSIVLDPGAVARRDRLGTLVIDVGSAG